MNSPLAKCDEPSVAELRAESRTHLFLVAILAVGAASTPVHIRNLSASGALIEGSALPAVGAVVSIRRAGLFVEGVLAWRSKNQAGVAFKSNILVSAWLPGKSRLRQCTIDQIVFEARNWSEVTTDRPQLTCTPLDPNWALVELNSLRSELVKLGDVLVQDVILVATHPEIQLLDIAIQRIDRLLSLAAGSGMAQKQRTA